MPRTIGKYNLVRELAQGGMGVVWEAYDTQLQRPVAIKLMHGFDAESSSQLARFEREAQAVARLQSPHVVRLYDYGVYDEGKPYMVMELLEGETLDERLKRTKIMTPAALLPLLIQVTQALQAAHDAGIVHCDLKPGNIFLAQQGVELTVKILDFGIAAMLSEPRAAGVEDAPRRSLAGTPPYMSPEQVRSDGLDHRTDLWSLAVIAYQALTGRMPFGADESVDLLVQICQKPVAPPSSHVPGLHPGLDAFFARGLARDLDERFSSAHEMALAFTHLVRDDRAGPTKVLVVDDEHDMALLLRQCFRRQMKEGRYQFFFASNGIEGLQALRDHPDVDIALTDLRMPGMDGLTFLDQIGTVAPALRTIVISAYSDMGNIRQAMNSGAFDFLTKPLNFVDLERTIEKAAREVRKLRRALQSMEENEALRMFVEPSVRERLLPILRMSGSMTGELLDATVAIICIQSSHLEDARTAIEYLNGIYDVIVPVLEAHQGTVARFLGYELLAVFHGADHCQRAIKACLEAHARAELENMPYDAGIGIASGPVMAGSVGAPSKRRFDYAVFGKPVQVAYTLKGLAEPGQILIEPSLARSLDEQFQCEPVGDQSQDVLAVRAVAQRSPDDQRWATALPINEE